MQSARQSKGEEKMNVSQNNYNNKGRVQRKPQYRRGSSDRCIYTLLNTEQEIHSEQGRKVDG